MKKVNFLLCLMAILILGGCTYKDSTETRIRIIANSNSEIDQEDKIKLRDALLEVLTEKSPQLKEVNPEEIKYSLLQKKININNQYKVEFKQETFPAKVLDGQFLPSGTYMTLLITIGEGKGENWWSVLYPEFFGVSYEDDNEIKYRSYIYDWLNN